VRKRTYAEPATLQTRRMKRETTPLAAGARPSEGRSLTDATAEAVLYREIAELGKWLAAQGLDVREDHPNHEGSRDRLNWRYGYFVGMKQALALLTSGGATVH
jgi:hypothetical protein